MSLLKGPRIFTLLMLISFGSISAVLFTPALPEIARYFKISDSIAQATMSIYLIGYALGQLPYAPLANRFGRKQTIYIGLILALFGTLFCWLAPTYHWLLIGRFLQALGAAVGLKITFTMVGDSHEGSHATKILSYIMLAFAAAPGLGIAAGGFLTASYGWQSCFFILTIYALALGVFCLFLPETARHLDREALQGKKILHGYLRQLTNPALMLHALLSGLGTAVIYIFATQAPYIGINQIGLSPETYGLFNLIPPIGLASGMIISSRLAGKITPRIAILSGILVATLGAMIMSVCFANKWVIAWTLFLPQALIMVGNSIVYSTASAEALSSSSDKSNASAILQFMSISIGACGTYLISSWLPKAATTLPLVFGTIWILAFGIWLKLKPHHR